MKAENQNTTGTTDALKYAHDVLRKLGYSHKKLTRENPEVNMNRLRRIANGEELKPYNQVFYMKLFTRLLMDEFNKCLEQGDTGREILRVMAQIHCLENGFSLDEKHEGVNR